MLDECEEYLRGLYFYCCWFILIDPSDPEIMTDKTRKLGLLVAKGTAVMVVNPMGGMSEIENPFVTE